MSPIFSSVFPPMPGSIEAMKKTHDTTRSVHKQVALNTRILIILILGL